MKDSLILGIESSCDETAVALVKDGHRVLTSLVASQMELHSRYGGVVPEVASRRHTETLLPLVREAFVRTGLTENELNGVAVTAAPGLIGALLVGLSFAKGLAFRLSLPLVAVHHVEAHLYACCLDAPPVVFPALGLVVSGGHTEIYRISDWGSYLSLCATRDDAAGEAFDKVAKLMGLGYPGGPVIERLAREATESSGTFTLTRMKDKSMDFSFSGLKTAVSLEMKKKPDWSDTEKTVLAAKFQRTVLAEILARVKPLLASERPKSLILGGGVACNEALRVSLREACSSAGVCLRVPPPAYCGDNAAMVAGLGARRIEKGERTGLSMNAVASPLSDTPFLIQ